jgi:hypothetical protein
MVPVEWDAQVMAWLDDVLAALRATGLADLVERTVAAVWERDVDRHDPVVAGDTATTLGITASENIRTLLLREDRDAWAARGVAITSVQQALVLRTGGLRLLLMKADPGGTGTRWDAESDVRRLAAEDNAARYEPPVEHQTGQTWWRFGEADGDPARLRHLVLLWSGDPVTATTVGRLGVPYAGPPGSPPWLAVATVWHHGPADVPHPRGPVIAVPRVPRDDRTPR